MAKRTIEIDDELDQVVKAEDLTALLARLDTLDEVEQREARLAKRCQMQTVLILQADKVIAMVGKEIPGLTGGKPDIGSIMTKIMAGTLDLSKLGPEMERLTQLLGEYKKTNAVLKT